MSVLCCSAIKKLKKINYFFIDNSNLFESTKIFVVFRDCGYQKEESCRKKNLFFFYTMPMVSNLSEFCPLLKKKSVEKKRTGSFPLLS